MMHNTTLSAIFYIFLVLLIQEGCLLLFKLSQFGQAPFEQLPMAVILFFGALFVAPLMAFRKRLEPKTRHLSTAIAILFTFGSSFFFQDVAPGGEFYLIAPLTALILTELLPRLFQAHAPMLAAMLVYIVCTLLANYTFDSFFTLAPLRTG